MSRRALVLGSLVAALVVVATPSALAEETSAEADASEPLGANTWLRATLGLDADGQDPHARTHVEIGDLAFDLNFWARPAADEPVEVDTSADEAVEETVERAVDDAVDVTGDAARKGLDVTRLDRLTSYAREATTPAADEPETHVLRADTGDDATADDAGTQSAAAAEAPTVPTEAMVLVTAAAASLGWAFGLPAALGEKLRHLAAILGLAGYTRLEKKDVLDHDLRESIYEAVQQNPGIAVADLAERFPAGRNTVVYHLRVLEREGFVRSERQGRRRVCYATAGGREVREDALAHAVLGHGTSRAIFEEIRDRPGLDQQALCEAVGVRPSLAHWHVRRLKDAGLLRKERDGRRVRYYAQADV